MCSIGWIKTKEGYILFKNRDTNKKYLRDNLFKKTENVAEVGYMSGRKGCWIGVNKYGIGFTSAKGPYIEIQEGFSSWIKFNELGEKILKSEKKLERAVKRFIREYKKQKIGESANILLCDKNKTFLLECCCGNVKIKAYSRYAVKTNHFELIKRFNQSKSLPLSVKRLKKIREVMRNHIPKTAEELIPLLRYHNDSEEDVCRKGKIMTVGSAVFEVTDESVIVNYVLNGSPCEGKYKRRKVN